MDCKTSTDHCLGAIMRCVINLLFVILVFISNCNFANAQSEKTSSQSNKDVDRSLEVISKLAFDKDLVVSRQAYLAYSSNNRLFGMLDEGNQYKLIENGIASNDANLIQYAFTMLSESKVSQEDRVSILIKSMTSSSSLLSQIATTELKNYQADIIDHLIETIGANPEGDHRSLIRIVEHLGDAAHPVVPTLLSHFDAISKRHQKALKHFGKGETSFSLDYLHLVYAIEAIGPSARDAIRIAISAADERGDERIEYKLAGVMALQTIGVPLPAEKVDVKKILATVSKSNQDKYRKYVDSLIDSFDSDGDGLIGPAEMKKMRRPPKVSADLNQDQHYSADELVYSYAANSPSSSSHRSSNNNTLRERVARAMREHQKNEAKK